MIFNGAGLSLLKEFEGCSLVAYQDQGGIWTVGYGCTHHVKPGMTITADEASDRLMDDIQSTASVIAAMISTQTLNDDQFSACVCLAYNIGVGDFKHSTLLNCIKTGHIDDAANEFTRWVKVNGVPNEGLTRRRLAEKALFIGLPDLENLNP